MYAKENIVMWGLVPSVVSGIRFQDWGSGNISTMDKGGQLYNQKFDCLEKGELLSP